MNARMGFASLLGMPFFLFGCGEPVPPVTPNKGLSPVQVSPAPAASNSQFDPAQAARGRKVYRANCQTCHGPEGKGQGGDWRIKRPNGWYPPPPLDDSAHAWHHPTAVLRKAIEQGSSPEFGDMPPWKDKLSSAEIDDVIVYIKSLWSAEVYQRWLEIERNATEN